MYAINSSFYSTVNDLVTLATGGTVSGIVDRSSFVDAGKKLASYANMNDFKNAFAAEIANKVQLSIDTIRGYEGRYKKMARGRLPANGVIEIITHGWASAVEPKFASLTDDGTVDMYVIKKPTQNVDYFTKSNAFSNFVTLQDFELEGAFKSPEAMAQFLSNKILMLMNSYELEREVARTGLLADVASDIHCNETALDGASDVYKPGMRYNLLKMYNDLTSSELTTANCLFNEDFVRFACNVIRQVSGAMESASTEFNRAGAKTFTKNNGAERDTWVASAFVAAMASYIKPYPGNPGIAVIPENYTEVAYWESAQDPLSVNYDKAKYSSGTGNGKINGLICMITDFYAIGEYIERESVIATPYNARGEYYNEFINAQAKYIRNPSANTVIFYCDDEEV